MLSCSSPRHIHTHTHYSLLSRNHARGAALTGCLSTLGWPQKIRGFQVCVQYDPHWVACHLYQDGLLSLRAGPQTLPKNKVGMERQCSQQISHCSSMRTRTWILRTHIKSGAHAPHEHTHDLVYTHTHTTGITEVERHAKHPSKGSETPSLSGVTKPTHLERVGEEWVKQTAITNETIGGKEGTSHAGQLQRNFYLKSWVSFVL